MSLGFNILGLALLWALLPSSLMATTYYVDITNGSDANDGRAKTVGGGHGPWAHAPGMHNATGLAASTTINPGDSIILRGCQTWGNASFPWVSPAAGTSSAQVYVGVDKTWWDSTVSGCATAWNRPILNAGAASVMRADGLERIIGGTRSYVTWDDLEIANVLCTDEAANSSHETHVIDVYSGGPTGMVFQNLYIHGWVNPYFLVGTGNVIKGSYTITNFVPFSYSPSPQTSWPSTAHGLRLQAINPFGSIPIGNNSPTVTSITGSNPYSITFTNTAGPATSNCSHCVIQMGEDNCRIFSGGETGNGTSMVANTVIDGSDTAEAQLNPYPDCGLSEGNNNWCGQSGTAEWRGPQIWRNNVIRYVSTVAAGACTEWSGNLIEYVGRAPVDPTGHTNGIECLDDLPLNGATFSYNNVIRHTNNPNPNTASGRGAIGLLDQHTPQSGCTAYIFNNVVYDTITNVPFGLATSGYNCGANGCGSMVLFNNTVDGGPSWSSKNYDAVNSCPSAYAACAFENNHLVSNISSSVLLRNCGSNCTDRKNLVQSFRRAAARGYTASETYAYLPVSGGSTIGAGANLSSLCSTISSINAAAGTACLSDTTYGAVYNTSNHTAVTAARTPNLRPSASPWDIGAYSVAGAVSQRSSPSP